MQSVIIFDQLDALRLSSAVQYYRTIINPIIHGLFSNLFYMGMAYDKPILHSFCCHFSRNEANRLKTWWQFLLGSSRDLNKEFLIIFYEKTSKIFILKNPVRNFSFFKQFSWILGLGATIPDFGLGDPGSNPGWN